MDIKFGNLIAQKQNVGFRDAFLRCSFEILVYFFYDNF